MVMLVLFFHLHFCLPSFLLDSSINLFKYSTNTDSWCLAMFWSLCYCGSNNDGKQATQLATNGDGGLYVQQGSVGDRMNVIHTAGQTFTVSMVATFVFRGRAAARGVNNITADAVPRAQYTDCTVYFTI
jgi:hypothetical protein